MGVAARITAVRFAHRSRRLMIRTVSQTQQAAKATPEIEITMVMVGSYSALNLTGRLARDFRDCD